MLFVWEEKAEKVVKRLVRLASSARRELEGINIMGGCSACGSTQKGHHDRQCLIPKLESTIKEVKSITKWR